MSLTNPVLNDIIIKEIEELKSLIKTIDNDLSGKLSSVYLNNDHTNKRVEKQDSKIDLIHKLFNTIKHSNVCESNEEVKENVNFKKMVEDLDVIVNEKFNLYSNHINSIITGFNNDLTHKMKIIEQTFNNTNESINNIKTNISNISKNINDLNYRVNSLEQRYRNVSDNMNMLNNDETYANKEYPPMEEGNNNESNWVKVTKKHKNKPYSYNNYNNRY